jgi:hypothetical protein
MRRAVSPSRFPTGIRCLLHDLGGPVGGRPSRGDIMLDILVLGAGVGLFAAMIAYAALCERL